MARKETDKRVTATVDEAYYEKLKYIAERKGISMSDLFRDAMDLYIRYVNEDYYPLAKVEAERVNQLTDHVVLLSADVKNLERIVITGFDSLLNLTRGDTVETGNFLSNQDENG